MLYTSDQYKLVPSHMALTHSLMSNISLATCKVCPQLTLPYYILSCHLQPHSHHHIPSLLTWNSTPSTITIWCKLEPKITSINLLPNFTLPLFTTHHLLVNLLPSSKPLSNPNGKQPYLKSLMHFSIIALRILLL